MIIRTARPRTTEIERQRADCAVLLFDEARGLASQTERTGDRTLTNAILDHAWHIIREAEPVRLLYVKELLELSDQTVRDWTDASLLEDFGGSPRRVGLESVVRVRDLVRELRAEGQQRDLMRAVLRRLELDELGDDERFQESVEQMRRGERA